MTHETQGLRHPEGAWGWGAASAALAVAVAPQLVVLAIVPEARTTDMAARTIGLVVYTVIGASGIYMYLHHRLTHADSTAWLASCLIVLGGVGLTVTGVDLTTADQGAVSFPVTTVDLCVLLALIVVIRVAERVQLSIDPAAVGLLVGVAACALTIVATTAGPELTLAPAATPVVVGGIIALAVVVAIQVRRLVTLPSWARDRLAIAIVALSVGRAALVVDGGSQGPLLHLGAVAAGTIAATLFLGTSLATLRLAIHDDRVAITALRDQLAATAAFARADRERLHEVKGTIAGIASASRLIHHAPLLPGENRELLEEMLERETARLQRLVQGDTPGPIGVVHLDDLLRPLVVARETQGQTVVWQRSGTAVWAREDDLAEVLNILLDNAAKHAPDATVAVFVQEDGTDARIVVADSGPGIPVELHSSLFDRGSRGVDSGGTGLGLHVARRLMIRSGGSLRLDDTWQQGAAFVVSTRLAQLFPEGRCDDDATHVVAQ